MQTLTVRSDMPQDVLIGLLRRIAGQGPVVCDTTRNAVVLITSYVRAAA